MYGTIIFIFFLLHGHAQVLITPQLPPTGLVKKDQLWNVVVINSSERSYDVQLQIAMQDLKTGEKVLTGASRLLTISKGARQLQINDVNPVQYNYNNAAASIDRTGNGLLPIGTYQICYTLVEQSGKSSLPATEECMPVEILPLSPPQLNTPMNKDTVATIYPLLQWIPPVPLTMFTDLNYELMLVELLKGQNVNEAIQKNMPLYFQSNIKNMFLTYPSSAKALEEGKTYAWQVVAKNGNNYTEKTESWQFTIRKGPQLKEIRASGFPRLQQGTGASYYMFDETLKFAYINSGGDSLVAVNFYNATSVPPEIIYTRQIKMTGGENLISDDILNKRVFSEGVLYRLEITDRRAGKWEMLFKYKKTAQ